MFGLHQSDDCGAHLEWQEVQTSGRDHLKMVFSTSETHTNAFGFPKLWNHLQKGIKESERIKIYRIVAAKK